MPRNIDEYLKLLNPPIDEIVKGADADIYISMGFCMILKQQNITLIKRMIFNR